MFNFKVVFPNGKPKRVFAKNLTEAEDKVVKYMKVKSITSARLAGKSTLVEIIKIDSVGSRYWKHKGFKFLPVTNLTQFQVNFLFNDTFS